MNSTKTRSGRPPEPPLSCYRLWMKPKTTKKPERRGYTLLGQFLLGPKNGTRS